MAITEVNPHWEDRECELTMRGRRYRVPYVITSDTWAEKSKDVASAPGVPQPYIDYLGEDPDAICVRVTVRPKSNAPLLWEATVEYETSTGSALQPQNPLERDPEIEWTFSTIQVVMEKDYDDAPVVNSAGDYFDPPMMTTEMIPVLRIVRNEETFSATNALTYVNHTNTAPFMGGSAGQVLLASMSSRRLMENGVDYWSVSYEFQYRERGWEREVVSMGFKQLNDEGSLINIKDANNEDIVTPAKLDDVGHAMSPAGAPHYMTFRSYPETSFAGLGFA